MIYTRLNITASTLPMVSLLGSIKNARSGGLDISPDYQRQYVWSNDYKDQLIISIILNYPIGNIVINYLDGANSINARQEVVDGKQRLMTILRFMECGDVGRWVDDENDHWYKLGRKATEEAKQIIHGIIKNSDDEGLAKMDKVPKLSFRDLPEAIQRNFEIYNLPVYTMHAADPAQIREYFKVLQNQEKLRAGEIINAIPDNPITPYFEVSGYQKFLDAVGFKSARNDFEKVYCAMLGLWSSNVPVNSSDSSVIDFVSRLKGLDDAQLTDIGNLQHGMERVASAAAVGQITGLHHRSTKRTLELLLGVMLDDPSYFDTPDTDENGDVYAGMRAGTICAVSSKLAAFNSPSAEDVSFAKSFGDEYTKDKEEFIQQRAPIYRQLFMAASRSTNKGDFRKAIQLLKLVVDGRWDRAYTLFKEQ